MLETNIYLINSQTTSTIYFFNITSEKNPSKLGQVFYTGN